MSEELMLEEELNQLLEKAAGGQELPQFSTETCNTLYAIAFNFYENRKYQEAVHFFRFLTVVDTFNRANWMGLGAAQQMNKEYEEAVDSYGFAALLNENDPFAHFHAAECFFAIGQHQKGNIALDSAETTSKGDKKFSQLLSRIALIRQTRTIKN